MDETPIHHLPSVQGLHQAIDIPADAWVEFFRMCQEAASLARQRRAAKQQAEEPSACSESESEVMA